jgi:sialic acid synthase SpsE
MTDVLAISGSRADLGYLLPVVRCDMPVTIVAEGGCEHAGSLDEGKRIIDLALEAGADFVKFQIYDVTDLVSKRADPAQWELLR